MLRGGGSAGGTAPEATSTRTIAWRIGELYWPQLRPFPTPSGELDLPQITNKSAAILTPLRRTFSERQEARSCQDAEALLPFEVVAQVLDVVELTVARNPCSSLQTIDGVSKPFIYDIDWDEWATAERLRAGATIRLRRVPATS